MSETIIHNQVIGGTGISLNTATEKRAQPFSYGADRIIKNVTFSLKKNGSPNGSIRCSVQTDNAGKPSGTAIGVTETRELSSLTTSFVMYQMQFIEEFEIVANTPYWFVIEYVNSSNVVSPIAEKFDAQFSQGTVAGIVEEFTVTMNQNGSYYAVNGTAKHWLLDAENGNQYYVWYNVTDDVDTQTNPGVIGRTSVQVDILLADTISQIVTKTSTIVNNLADFNTSNVTSTSFKVSNILVGVAVDPIDVDASVSFVVNAQGTELTNFYDVNGIARYWLLSAKNGTNYYVWYNVTDGSFTQSNPGVGGRTGLLVNILKTDTPELIAEKTKVILEAHADFTAIRGGNIVTVTQSEAGAVTNPTDNNASVNITVIIEGNSTDNRLLINANTGGSSSYFTSTWNNVTNTFVMRIISLDFNQVGWTKKPLKAPLDQRVVGAIQSLGESTAQLLAGLDVIIQALDVAKVFFTATNDIFALIMNTVIEELEAINNDFFGTGAYQLAIHPFSVGKKDLRREAGFAKKPYDIEYITPKQAINYAINSFDDIGDEFRPNFSDNAYTSAVAILITAKDLGLYISLMKRMAAVWDVREIQFAIAKAEEQVANGITITQMTAIITDIILHDEYLEPLRKNHPEFMTYNEVEKIASAIIKYKHENSADIIKRLTTPNLYNWTPHEDTIALIEEAKKSFVDSTGADWDSLSLNKIKALGDIQKQINDTLGLCKGYTLVPAGVQNLIDALRDKVADIKTSIEVFLAVINDLANIPELANVYVLDIPLALGGNKKLKEALYNPEFLKPEFDIYRYTFMLMYVGGGPSKEYGGNVEALRKLVV